jgi:hypothetical protein
MVSIKLARTGTKHQAHYRFVVLDRKKPTNGAVIECRRSRSVKSVSLTGSDLARNQPIPCATSSSTMVSGRDSLRVRPRSKPALRASGDSR